MDVRLAILGSIDEDMPPAEAVRLALEQAVTEVGGVGGMVHVRWYTAKGLHLLASSGLPPALAQPWSAPG